MNADTRNGRLLNPYGRLTHIYKPDRYFFGGFGGLAGRHGSDHGGPSPLPAAAVDTATLPEGGRIGALKYHPGRLRLDGLRSDRFTLVISGRKREIRGNSPRVSSAMVFQIASSSELSNARANSRYTMYRFKIAGDFRRNPGMWNPR